ncbi:hypothetical protein ACN73V_004622, partial [Escherichia coli]
SWLKAGMVWQGGGGIGKIYQSVPAYAGLRRFYSGITCNHSVPPYMPLKRHSVDRLCTTRQSGLNMI